MSPETVEHIGYEVPPTLPRVDHYEIRLFTEESDPDLAELAWAMHAVGYEKMHLVKPIAVDPVSGKFGDGIDKSRGPSVDYRIAVRPDDNAVAVLSALEADPSALHRVGSLDAATMRKVHIPFDGSIDDLPGYKLCKEKLYPWGEEYLRSIEDPQAHIKEISALTPTSEKSKAGVYELIRDAIQDAQRKKEIWFCSIVSTTNRALSRDFGPGVMVQIGEEVAIDDPRVSDDIKLVPVAIDIDKLIGRTYDNYLTEIDPVAKEKNRRSFLYFSAGLDESKLDRQLMIARDRMLQEQN
jgi:hypothetical protein